MSFISLKIETKKGAKFNEILNLALKFLQILSF